MRPNQREKGREGLGIGSDNGRGRETGSIQHSPLKLVGHCLSVLILEPEANAFKYTPNGRSTSQLHREQEGIVSNGINSGTAQGNGSLDSGGDSLLEETHHEVRHPAIPRSLLRDTEGREEIRWVRRIRCHYLYSITIVIVSMQSV
jgi:hypothetical protein